MENINRNKWLGALLALLIIANIASLGTFWFLRTKSNVTMPPGNQGGRNASVFLIKELAFTKPQQIAYEQLIQKHQGQVQRLRRQMGPLKDHFFSSVKDSTLLPPDLENLAGQIGEKEKELHLVTFYHFREVRQLCSPAQKVKFDQIISQVMRMVAPRPPEGRPGNPPPGPGRDGRRPPPPPGSPDMPPPGEAPPPPPE